MRKLSETEILSLREMLQMETNNLITVKTMLNQVNDEQLKKYVETAVLTNESRIRGIQQFINENQVINIREVH